MRLTPEECHIWSQRLQLPKEMISSPSSTGATYHHHLSPAIPTPFASGLTTGAIHRPLESTEACSSSGLGSPSNSGPEPVLSGVGCSWRLAVPVSQRRRAMCCLRNGYEYSSPSSSIPHRLRPYFKPILNSSRTLTDRQLARASPSRR